MWCNLASQNHRQISGLLKVGHPAVPWQYLALLDEVSSFPEVEDDVPRHPGGEQSAGHLANSR